MSVLPENFDAALDFTDSLREVDVLCDAAESAHEGSHEYSTFNKAALLLVAGKFEAFAESIVEEFVFLFNEMELTCNKIPDTLRLHHTFSALRVLEHVRHRQKHEEAVIL